MRRSGYIGGSQRIVAVKDDKREVLAWGDDVTADELGRFMMGWPDHEIEIEWVENPVLEACLYPPTAGSC